MFLIKFCSTIASARNKYSCVKREIPQTHALVALKFASRARSTRWECDLFRLKLIFLWIQEDKYIKNLYEELSISQEDIIVYRYMNNHIS